MESYIGHQRKGYAAILSIVLGFFLFASIVSLASIQQASMQARRGLIYREVAYRAAEAGLELAIQRLTSNRSYTTGGTTGTCVWDPGVSASVSCTYTYSVSPLLPPRSPGETNLLVSEGELKINGVVVGRRVIQTRVGFGVPGTPKEYKLIHYSWEEG